VYAAASITARFQDARENEIDQFKLEKLSQGKIAKD